MPVPVATLQALASGFSATRIGPEVVQPGQPVRVRLSPSTVDVQATDLLSGELSLTWITKNVRFKNHSLEAAFADSPFDPAALANVLDGGMPARVPVVGNIVGTQELPGVPGQLAQLAGTVPIPVSTELPVQVAVKWTVHDETGTAVAPGPTSFSTPQGTAGPDVSFVFAPQTVELTSAVSVPVVRRFIRATVTLTAGATQHVFPLPDIPVVIPAIPIPTVVVFFLHPDFAASVGDDAGAAFIVVPNNSPLKSTAQLQATLNTIQSTLGSLTSVANFAAFLLGLQELSNALAAQPQPNVQFRVADGANEIKNFNEVTLIERAWYQNNTEAEDELSSMIFIGPEGKGIRCFNFRNTRSGDGAFTLTIGPKLHAFVRTLHAWAPTSGPDTGELVVDVPPPSWPFPVRRPDTFGDELSSMLFL